MTKNKMRYGMWGKHDDKRSMKGPSRPGHPSLKSETTGLGGRSVKTFHPSGFFSCPIFNPSQRKKEVRYCL